MHLRISTDGGSRGNPGPAAGGVVITDEHGKILLARGYFFGEATNNVAEYRAVLYALEEATRLGGTVVELRCDSELVVRQLNGQYRVKNAFLRDLYTQVCEQMQQFEQIDIRHTERNNNIQADSLVNAALDAEKDVTGTGGVCYPDEAQWEMLDLDVEIQFSDIEPLRKIVCCCGGVTSELFCLKAGQQCTVQLGGSWVTVTTLRGRGNIMVEGKAQATKSGGWACLSGCGKVEFAADGSEPLVVLLTYNRR